MRRIERNGRYKRTKKPVFKDEEMAVNCIVEGFLGWDTYEIIEILCKMIPFISNEDMPDVDKISVASDELLKIIQEGKRNRIKVATGIRELWKTEEYTQEHLAKMYDVPEDSICSIVTNKTLYDKEYQKWINSKNYIVYVDEDGRWIMRKSQKSDKDGKY